MLEARPDAARLRIQCRARSKDSPGAHRDVAATSARVDAVLEAHAGAIRKRSTSGLLVTPAYEWTDKGRRSVGWDGVHGTTVEITDPAAIGAIFAGVAEAGATLGGVEWLLDATNVAHAEARTAAALDARARAEAYAAALGVRLGEVLEVREPSVVDERPSRARSAPMAMEAATAGSAAPEVVVEAPDLSVTAEVDVTFALLG
jgi:uncharacterized protein YggE